MDTPPRSYLFVPGNRPERFDKALASGAHAVILDLEDAVPAEEKARARQAVSSWLARQTRGAVQLLVRVNPAGDDGFEGDIDACRAHTAVGIVLPKAETVDDVRRVHRSLKRRTAVLPLIESARGFGSLEAIAAAAGVQRLAFGTIDFQLDMNIVGDDAELLFFRSRMVLASRLAGLPAPIDGVTTDLADPLRIRSDTERTRRLGFGAKLCIHPRQVVAVNESFAPTPGQLEWAQRVVSAAGTSRGSAVELDGQMIDRPVLLKAQRLLATASSPHHPTS